MSKFDEIYLWEINLETLFVSRGKIEQETIKKFKKINKNNYEVMKIMCVSPSWPIDREDIMFVSISGSF